MSDVYRRILSGLSLRTLSTSPAPSTQGDINIDLASGNLQYHNGTVLNKVATETNTLTLTNKTLDASLNTLSNIVDANIKAAAGIVYSKLNLTGGIVNADVSNTAGIVYSKLNLSASIVNGDIANAAAIAYSKLNLANSVQLTDLANLAANSLIGNTTGSSATPSAVPVDTANTANAVVIRDGSGNFSAGTITGTLSANADVNMGSHKVTNLANGVAGTDGVNLNQLQNALSGVQWRPETDLLDSTDTTLPTGTSATIDGVSVVNGMRVLFTNLASNNNEIYVVSGVGSSLAWAAALDNDRTSAAPVKGDSVLILQGTTYSEAAFNYNGTNWVQFNGAGQIQAGSGLSKSGNTLSISTIATGNVLANTSGSSAVPSATTLTKSPTASSVVLRDSNANTQLNNLIENGQTVTTAAGTTTLTVASPYFTQFNGSSTQTCQLPSASTLVQYQSFYIANRSAGTVTVTDGSGSTVSSMLGATQAIFTVTNIGSTAGSWDVSSSAASSGGSGGTKNYLTTYLNNTGNGNFEQGSTTGWSLFNTTLTSKIPTGSITAGASSVGTFSAAGGGPLAGTYSLLTQTAAAWTAGQGFITDVFTIDVEDKAKVMGISFSYLVAAGGTNFNFSGTSSNTFAVYVYDVTNSAWIQPAGVYNLVQGSGAGKCVATFQTTSNSSQYRLAVLAVNASGGAGGMYWDDFFVGPQTAVMGPAMGDWQSYTPTFGGIGTPTSVNFYYRRVGDSIQIQGSANAGTVAASQFQIGLPTGTVIDSTKLSGTIQRVGVFSRAVAAAVTDSLLAVGGNTFLNVGIQSGSASDSAAQNGNSVLASTEFFSISGQVPVTGWSSNTVMSSDTDTRDVSATAYSNGAIGTTNGGIIIFPTVDFDTHAAYNASTGVYTVPVSGIYDVSLAGVVCNNGALQALTLFKNGSASRTVLGTTSTTEARSGIVSIKVNAGDTLDVRSNGTAGISQSGNQLIMISFKRHSGPAVVAATEEVYAKYYCSTNQATSANSAFNFDTKVKDTHAAVTTGASWKFTAPVSGEYSVTGFIGSATGNTTAYMIYKNGSADSTVAHSSSGANVSFTGSIPVNAGDTIYVGPQANSQTATGGSLSTAEVSSITIFRIK